MLPPRLLDPLRLLYPPRFLYPPRLLYPLGLLHPLVLLHPLGLLHPLSPPPPGLHQVAKFYGSLPRERRRECLLLPAQELDRSMANSRDWDILVTAELDYDYGGGKNALVEYDSNRDAFLPGPALCADGHKGTQARPLRPALAAPSSALACCPHNCPRNRHHMSLLSALVSALARRLRRRHLPASSAVPHPNFEHSARFLSPAQRCAGGSPCPPPPADPFRALAAHSACSFRCRVPGFPGSRVPGLPGASAAAPAHACT